MFDMSWLRFTDFKKHVANEREGKYQMIQHRESNKDDKQIAMINYVIDKLIITLSKKKLVETDFKSA